MRERSMTGREKKQNRTELARTRESRVRDRNYFKIKRDIKNPPSQLRCTNTSLVCSKHQWIPLAYIQNKILKPVTLHPNLFKTLRHPHKTLATDKRIVTGKVLLYVFTNSKVVLKAAFLSPNYTREARLLNHIDLTAMIPASICSMAMTTSQGEYTQDLVTFFKIFTPLNKSKIYSTCIYI